MFVPRGWVVVVVDTHKGAEQPSWQRGEGHKYNAAVKHHTWKVTQKRQFMETQRNLHKIQF